jgi:hypothetical protein
MLAGICSIRVVYCAVFSEMLKQAWCSHRVYRNARKLWFGCQDCLLQKLILISASWTATPATSRSASSTPPRPPPTADSPPNRPPYALAPKGFGGGSQAARQRARRCDEGEYAPPGVSESLSSQSKLQLKYDELSRVVIVPLLPACADMNSARVRPNPNAWQRWLPCKIAAATCQTQSRPQP